jgi:hypothetical protein
MIDDRTLIGNAWLRSTSRQPLTTSCSEIAHLKQRQAKPSRPLDACRHDLLKH